MRHTWDLHVLSHLVQTVGFTRSVMISTVTQEKNRDTENSGKRMQSTHRWLTIQTRFCGLQTHAQPDQAPDKGREVTMALI